MAIDNDKIWNNVESSDSYIHQIEAGGTTYDLATHHSITFYDGRSDSNPVSWNGVSDLEIIIPSLADLVTDPIKFGGVANGAFPTDPEKGEVYFVGTGWEGYEAGDMLIWDGTKWYAVSGENQIAISGAQPGDTSKIFTINGTAQDILTIEGKTVKLNVDYTGVEDVLSVTMNEALELPVTGNVVVAPAYVALSKAADTTTTIGDTVNIDLPTALANGTVTINEKVLVSDDINLNAGVLPSASLNAASIAVTASTAVGIAKITGVDFVASIDGAVKSAALTGTREFVATYASKDGKQFVNGLHAAATDTEKANPVFTIPGAVSIDGTKTFATGFGDADTTGDVLSSITIGSVGFAADDGGAILASLGTPVASGDGDVITSVSFGSVTAIDGSMFVKGLNATESASYDVLTKVSLGDVTFASAANSDFADNAVIGASVSNHVLSFNTGSFMKPVSLNKPTVTLSGKTFSTGAVSLTGYGVSSASFTKGNLVQPEVTKSYKTLVTGSFELAHASDTAYVFDKAFETQYDFTKATVGISTVDASIAYGAYDLTNTGITAYIPENKVVTGISAGVLPSLTFYAASGNLTASVSTALASTAKSWIALKSADLSVAGAYTLVSDSDADGAIEVAAASTYALASGAKATIDANEFITAVYVSDSEISEKK